ncbi:MAG: hypothetical protein JWM82_1693 [Myxococcales bacterium]|nr:hypothetical protein [Myxococcales bacterium]
MALWGPFSTCAAPQNIGQRVKVVISDLARSPGGKNMLDGGQFSS